MSEKFFDKFRKEIACDLEPLKDISKILEQAKKSAELQKTEDRKEKPLIPDEDWARELETRKTSK